MAHIIDGKAVASVLLENVKREASRFEALTHIKVTLATVLVGDDPASQIYVQKKIDACRNVGIAPLPVFLPLHASANEVSNAIISLNDDPAVHGILLQLPLPAALNAFDFLPLIDPRKDVDGLHPYNQGLLAQNQTSGFTPCTPQGCMRLIHTVQHDLTGLNALVIGRSLLVGHPMAELLNQAECTVTIAHRHTQNIVDLARQADIIVAATGVAKLVKGSWVKEGSILIDVGITRNSTGKLVGDIAFSECAEKAIAITPVPGGVGPMTVACLLANTVKAAYRQTNHSNDLPAELFSF